MKIFFPLYRRAMNRARYRHADHPDWQMVVPLALGVSIYRINS